MRPGDLVVCHSKGIIGAGIRWSQRHMGDNQYSTWNHVAIVDRIYNSYDDETPQCLVIQAEAKGVTDNHSLDSIAPGGKYEIIPLPVQVDRSKFLEFVRFQVGEKYGYLSILSCALDMFLPESICLRKSSTWICSGLVAAGLMYAGFKPALAWPDLYTVVPAEIADLVSSMG